MQLPADTHHMFGQRIPHSPERKICPDGFDPETPRLYLRTREIDRPADGVRQFPRRFQTELETNPFLAPSVPAFARQLGMVNATDTDVFAEIRARKDVLTAASWLKSDVHV